MTRFSHLIMLLSFLMTASMSPVASAQGLAKDDQKPCTSDTVVWVNTVDMKLPCGEIKGSLPRIINPDLQKLFTLKLTSLLMTHHLFYPISVENLCSKNVNVSCKQLDLQKGQTLSVNFDTRILQASDDFVSIRVDVPYNFVPSAHPSSTGLFFNFKPNVKADSVVNGLDGLSAKDQEKLINQVAEELQKRGIDGSVSTVEGKTLQDKIEKLLPGHVGFTTTEAVFVFWRYEIAPGSAGTQVVRIPFNRSVSTSG